jgi:thiol:disulfide interchange protein DsbA
MQQALTPKRRLWTIVLALIGIGTTVAYALCLGACSSLRGDLFGIDLKYLGIFFMAVVIALAWLRRSLLLLLLLAFGAGGELFLIGYQIRSSVYCPFCLVFGAAVLAAFAISFDPRRKVLAALAAAAGLLFFLLFFSGSTTPAFAQEPPLPVYGRGSVEVRLYTDYFCDPCRAEEMEVISLLTELNRKNIIRLIFVDTPVHPETVLYVGYFLAALNARNDFEQAVAARSALFEAAGRKIVKKEALEAFLKTKKIKFKPVDTEPAYKFFTGYLKEDKINSTPTCVIVGPQGKQTLLGGKDIAKGLRELLK